jgi:deoxycitidine kinase/deoxyguanosine kinase
MNPDERVTYLHETKNKEVKIISIDGNIGSGKSTLVENLKIYFKDNKNICFLQEPVSIWENIKDINGVNILVNYYKDQKKYAFAFQMMAYISRLSILKEALKSNNYNIIITERSVETDRMIFAKMLYDNNIIEEIEYNIYNKWFNEFIDDLPKFKYIYVKTTPDIANERIIKRNRDGEHISLDYLTKCHNYHELWLNNLEDNRILQLDGTLDNNKNKKEIEEWFIKIRNFIKI